MKQLLIYLLLALPMAAFSKSGGDQNPGFDAIKNALATGDVDGLGRYFGESVEISIMEKEQIYSKSQALDAVRAFFSQNKPKGFAQMHTGKNKGNDDEYCIGNLTTGGATYRVYLYLMMGSGQPTIKEIRFDKA